jgi:hypothetical protein
MTAWRFSRVGAAGEDDVEDAKNGLNDEPKTNENPECKNCWSNPRSFAPDTNGDGAEVDGRDAQRSDNRRKLPSEFVPTYWPTIELE